MKNKTSTIYTSNLLIHHRFVSIKRRKKESKKNYIIHHHYKLSIRRDNIVQLFQNSKTRRNERFTLQRFPSRNSSKSPKVTTDSQPTLLLLLPEFANRLIPSKTVTSNARTRKNVTRTTWSWTMRRREVTFPARTPSHPHAYTYPYTRIPSNPQHLLTLFLAGVGRCWALSFLPANKRHRGNGTALRSLFDKRSRGMDRSIDRSMDEKPLAAGIGGMRKKINAAVAPMTSDIRFRARQNEQGFSACTPLRSFPFHAL